MQLSAEQLDAYRRTGYLSNVPALDPHEVSALLRGYEDLARRLPPGRKMYQLAQWEKKNVHVFRVCTHPKILEVAESLLGPDFYVWDAYFFDKGPRQDVRSQFHFDMGSWPLSEGRHASVFLAVTDTTRANGCLAVVEGSHLERYGHTRLRRDRSQYLFGHEVPESEIPRDRIRWLELRAGELSLHHPLTLHGSGPNTTDQLRVGLAIRYATFDVRANLTLWPQFAVIPVRGKDRFRVNPVRRPPTDDGIPELHEKPHCAPRALFARIRFRLRRTFFPNGRPYEPSLITDRRPPVERGA